MGCIHTAWLSYFFIRDALSAAKTKFYASPPLNLSTSSTSYDTSETPISKTTAIPLHFTSINDPPKKTFNHTKYKLAFTSRNSIGMVVFHIRGKSKGTTHQLAVVYMISLESTSTGKNLPYIWRTNRPLNERLSEHRNDIAKVHTHCAMVKHVQNNPGHKYDLKAARIIWFTNNIIESKMVESAFIQTLPCCNTHPGEISMSPIMSSVITKITKTKISDPADRRRRQLTSPLFANSNTPFLTLQHLI